MIQSMLSVCVYVIQVADCVCLMSLDKSEAVPVDTHVWQIARRDYNCAAGGGQKTLTDKVYREIGENSSHVVFPFALFASPQFLAEC